MPSAQTLKLVAAAARGTRQWVAARGRPVGNLDEVVAEVGVRARRGKVRADELRAAGQRRVWARGLRSPIARPANAYFLRAALPAAGLRMASDMPSSTPLTIAV
jgi:hypothetical protein